MLSTSTAPGWSEVAAGSEFDIPHADKIEWMIEQNGWALEPVPPNIDSSPPVPGYAYTIGFPARFGFAEVVIFGLTPVAARGLMGLVAAILDGGTEIPLGVELTGVLDGEQRCVFGPVPVDDWGELFATATSWYRGADFRVVQMLWPDRSGFLPYEAGYDSRLARAQPVLAAF